MAKRTTVDDLRQVIAAEAVGLDDLAELTGVSVHTLTLWARGGVPIGAPSFPLPVKSIGKARVYCRTEAVAWVDAHRAPRKG